MVWCVANERIIEELHAVVSVTFISSYAFSTYWACTDHFLYVVQNGSRLSVQYHLASLLVNYTQTFLQSLEFTEGRVHWNGRLE